MSEDVIYASSEKKDDKDELDHPVHLIIKLAAVAILW